MKDNFNDILEITRDLESILLVKHHGNSTGGYMKLFELISELESGGESQIKEVISKEDDREFFDMISLENLLKKQIKLLEDYVTEKGSVYYTEHEVLKLTPYVLFFTKFEGSAQYSSIWEFKVMANAIIKTFESYGLVAFRISKPVGRAQLNL